MRNVGHGSCHCGNITFELVWDTDPAEIPARACDCSFCTRHGGVWTSNPNGSLAVTIGEDSQVTEYAFGTRTAVFHICSRCGVVPVVTSEIDGRRYAVVSVNAFNDVPQHLLRRAATSFTGEDTGSRLARRKRNWIPDVQFAHRSRSGPSNSDSGAGR